MVEKITRANMVEVTNRNNGRTGYTLNSGIDRQFGVGETKKIDIEELRELQATSGGEYILKNCLLINDRNALEYLDIQTEPEYFYTEKEVRELLETGFIEQLEDCLNFAPAGVIELVKTIAVQMELPDTRKRKLIFEKTGFSVDNAIRVNQALAEEDKVEEPKPETRRKAAPIDVKTTPERKYSPKIEVKKD